VLIGDILSQTERWAQEKLRRNQDGQWKDLAGEVRLEVERLKCNGRRTPTSPMGLAFPLLLLVRG
jgi:hypothetical protein